MVYSLAKRSLMVLLQWVIAFFVLVAAASDNLSYGADENCHDRKFKSSAAALGRR